MTSKANSNPPSNGGGSQNSIDSLEDLMFWFYEDSVDAYHAFMGTYTDAVAVDDAPEKLVETYLPLLTAWHTQTAYQELLELIGETEVAPHKPDHLPQEQYMDFKSNMWARNDLRKELRTAAKAKYGQEE